MGFKLGRTDSMSKCMKLNEIERFYKRRKSLNCDFLKKVEFGLWDMDMADFITFSISYQTRRGTVNPHFGVEQLGFVF